MRLAVALLVVTLGGTTSLRAQVPVSDQQLLADRDFQNSAAFAQYRGVGNSDRVVQYRKQNWLAQYNPVSLALKTAMLGYQRLMSQQLARSCPYQITCSNFSKQAIEQYGIIKGVFLSADRIMRCNRIGLLDVPPMDISPADGTILDPLSRYR
ncbi:membrane protein insertion efficiency factor YidD [Spirosoma sp.]|uniref:membrane protein insertion efficiency factor YidD n=1 Tax=Spirosoma sp. TaxID=1899569 RepID=UPI002611C55E|nr:membrane protein insertion efficiency factor YidD [Spirosoma sp.]MCX6213036.1 membrane protein insertion efficiency factor YidD [Spirosoma sp.]